MEKFNKINNTIVSKKRSKTVKNIISHHETSIQHLFHNRQHQHKIQFIIYFEPMILIDKDKFLAFITN